MPWLVCSGLASLSALGPLLPDVDRWRGRAFKIREDRVRPQPAVRRAGKANVGTAAIPRNLTEELRSRFVHVYMAELPLFSGKPALQLRNIGYRASRCAFFRLEQRDFRP